MTNFNLSQKNKISYILVFIWILTTIIFKSITVKLAVLIFLATVSFYVSISYVKNLTSKDKISYIIIKIFVILIILILSFLLS